MNLRWTEFAVDRLDELVDDLEDRKGRDASRVVARMLVQRVGGLRELPRLGSPWRLVDDEHYRRLVVDEYVVLYRISESEELIHVLALRHGKQRPYEPGDFPSR